MNKIFEMPYGELQEALDWELMEAGLPPVGGWDEWASHQKACIEWHCKALDEALGIVRDENGVGTINSDEEYPRRDEITGEYL